jgi:hypothetical protein
VYLYLDGIEELLALTPINAHSRMSIWDLEHLTSLADGLCQHLKDGFCVVPPNASICDTDTVFQARLPLRGYLLSTYKS